MTDQEIGILYRALTVGNVRPTQEQGIELIRKLVLERASRDPGNLETALREFGIELSWWQGEKGKQRMTDQEIGILYRALTIGYNVRPTQEQGIELIRKLVLERAQRDPGNLETALREFGIELSWWMD